MSKPVEFVDELPEHPRSRGPRNAAIREFAQALRDNPGRWALHPTQPRESSMPTLAASRAWQINAGKSANLPNAEFEAASRGGKLYVRAVAE